MNDINESMSTYFPPITYEQYLLYSLIEVNEDNTVSIAKEYQEDFNEDDMPELEVSRLTYIFRNITLEYLPITFKDQSTTQGIWTLLLEKTKMFHDHPGLYQLIVMEHLEVQAILWSIKNQPEILHNVSEYDIARIRRNLDRICDLLGDYDNILDRKHNYYVHLIQRLRRLDIDLGFIQYRLGYIINQYGYTN